MAKTITQVRRDIILAFADCGMNAAEVGRKLFMDRGNVIYHLEVIKSITGLNPRNIVDLDKLVEMVKEQPKQEELNPCPFCGGQAFIEHYYQPKEEWRIKCTVCPTRFGRYAGLDKKEVTKAWNRRYEDGN